MLKSILVFRTDRIGALLLTCPAIFTLKDFLYNSKITLITSENNYEYAKSLKIFDSVNLFPKYSLIKKIKFIYNLSKSKFDYVFIFDGKNRSIISSIFVKSRNKLSKIVNKKQAFFCKLFKIKFYHDNINTNLSTIHQKILDDCKINLKIKNFDYLKNKKDNNFSSNILISDYIHIHLDEKWVSSLYNNEYKDINPSYDEFADFTKFIGNNYNLIITTGLIEYNLIENIRRRCSKKISDKIFMINSQKNNYFIYKPTFIDLESLLRKTKLLITCHGALTHAANCFDIKIIDIIEKTKENFDKRCTSYLKNYHCIYRNNFSNLKNELLKYLQINN